MLINIVTAWWRSQKGRPLWSHDWAHRVWALESWHPRTHQHAWCSLCSLVLIFCLTIWASRRQSCLAWGAYSWRNRHPSSLALSLLLDHTRQFHEWNCPWNCFRENVLIASRYSNDCFMMHYWCKLDFCNLQQGGKKNRTNQRWITLASMSCFCAVLLCTMCSHMCLPSFAAWENNTTLVWELALCTERVSERSQTFDACMEICPSDSWENFQSNFYLLTLERISSQTSTNVAYSTRFAERLQRSPKHRFWRSCKNGKAVSSRFVCCVCSRHLSVSCR